MNREQKSAAIAEIAARIDESDAIFAVDYRGITVAQLAELRARLRDADASFKVVKNSLTERAADEAGAVALKELLLGPTALTFVRGDVALAAKAVADFARTTQLLPFKGGMMGDEALEVEQIRSLSRLPSREVLYGQLVGVVASPVSGLVRTLNALISGLAVALGQVNAKKESGELPAGDPPAAPAPTEAEGADANAAGEPDGAGEADGADAPAGEAPPADADPAAEGDADAAAEGDADTAAEGDADAAAEGDGDADTAGAAQDDAPAQAEAEAAAESTPAEQAEEQPPAEPAQSEPAQHTDTQADASADEQPGAEANPTKED